MRLVAPRALPIAATAIAAMGIIPSATAATAPPSGAHTAHARGAAHLDWDGKQTGPWKSDLWVAIDDARATYVDPYDPTPASASGTIHVKHRFWNTTTHEDVLVWFDIDVDCVSVGGPVATLTGIANKHHSSGQESLEGVRVGLSVYTGSARQPGRVGALRSGTKENQIPLCAATAPTWPVKHGGYMLRRSPRGGVLARW